MLLTESQPTKGDKSGLIAVCCLFYDYLMFCLGLRNDFGSGSLAQLIFRKEVLFFINPFINAAVILFVLTKYL